MNQLDVYYRALLDYRQQTLANQNCTSLRNAIATSDVEQDKIVIKRAICTIENDWVDAIEAGLVHVEKALKEERQFIRSNGEVVPIEKVKHVSRESVEHLAKHSNLITKCEDVDNIIPEKIYTVERLSDFAVYENRFLYMLLCYLRDFITVRYNDIEDLSNRYEAEINFQKKISTGKQRMSYTLSMYDLKRDDPYLKESNPAKETIDRIHLLLKTVIAFLGIPLMQEVSKVAMLKPPITKTNVLKMNNNFKGAVQLYEFIMAYDKKGYQVEEQLTTLAPFNDRLADELAEAGGLVSFLAYEYGLGINKELKESYDREEERRKVERIQRRAEKIESLKRRLQNAEISIEEYTLTLEEQLRDLQGQAERAEKLAEELAIECEKTQNLTKQVEDLTDQVNQLYAEIEDMKIKHFQEIERLKQEHENAMHELIVRHETEMQECIARHEAEMQECIARHEAEMQECIARHEAEMQECIARHEAEMQECIARHEAEMQECIARHEAEMQACIDKYEQEVQELKDQHSEEVQTLKDQHSEEVQTLKDQHSEEVQMLNDQHSQEMQEQKDAAEAMQQRYEDELLITKEDAKTKIETMQNDHTSAMDDVQTRLAECTADLERTRKEYATLLEEHRVANARIKVLGGIPEGYTDRENFNQLENEYDAFTRLYKKQWKETKAEIKKKHLNIENLKDQKEKKK